MLMVITSARMKAFIRWVKKRIVVAGICVGCLVLTACGQKATPTEKEVSGDVIETESDAAGEKKVDKTSEDQGSRRRTRSLPSRQRSRSRQLNRKKTAVRMQKRTLPKMVRTYWRARLKMVHFR